MKTLVTLFILFSFTSCVSGSGSSNDNDENEERTTEENENNEESNPGESSAGESNVGGSSSGGSSSGGSSSGGDDGVVLLSFEDQAERLLLYSGCVRCHASGEHDFSDYWTRDGISAETASGSGVEDGYDLDSFFTKLKDVKDSFMDDNQIDPNEEQFIDDAISTLKEHAESNGGKPFSRTGSAGSMSDKDGVNHTSTEKEEIDELEEYISNLD